MQTFIKFFLVLLCSSMYAGGSYSVSLVNMSMDYTEYDDNDQFLDSEKSNYLTGLELSYVFDLECQEQQCGKLAFNFLGISGNTDYKGSYLISGEAVNSTTYNLLYDLGVEYKNKISGKYVDLLYGLGMGYHSWYRELSSSQNELYRWLYVTPMVGVSKNITDELELGVKVQYKYGIDPKITANFIEEDLKLSKADTIELHLPVSYDLNEQVKIFTQVIISKQDIGKSNYVSGYIDGFYSDTIHEPKSTDYQSYLKFGATIKY